MPVSNKRMQNKLPKLASRDVLVYLFGSAPSLHPATGLGGGIVGLLREAEGRFWYPSQRVVATWAYTEAQANS